MNASKENAKKARDLLNDHRLAQLPDHVWDFVTGFVDAAERKLPTEQAYINEKNRRKRPTKKPTKAKKPAKRVAAAT